MKKTLIYGALGGIALYIYLQLQKKKKLSAKETPSTKQDNTSGTSIPSGTGGIKPPKSVYGGIKPPKPVNGGIKPLKPVYVGIPVVKPKPVPPMSITTPKGEGDGVSVKNDAPTPPAPTVEPTYVGIKPPKYPSLSDRPYGYGEDELGRPTDIKTGQPIGMPRPSSRNPEFGGKDLTFFRRNIF